MFDSFPMGIEIFRLTEEGELQLADGNPAAEVILRTDIRSQFGRNIEEVFPDASGFPDACRKIAVDGGVVHEDVSLTFLDYSGVFALTGFQASPGQVAVTFQDISSERKAENDLIESEDVFRTTFINAPIGIVTADENTKFTSANDAFCKISGYTESELKEVTFREISHPDDVMESIKNVEDLISGKTSVYIQEKRYLKKDGSYFDAQAVVSLVRNPDGTPRMFIAQIEDISQRKESEELLRATVLNAPIGIATTGPDMHFVTANTVFCNTLGYSQDELHDLTFKEISHPDDIIDSIAKVNELRVGKISSFRLEKRYFRKDGTIITGRVTVSALRDQENNVRLFVVELEDITDQKQSELAVLESERKYRSIFEDSIEGIFQAATNGRFIMCNPALARMLGYETPEELIEDIDDLSTQVFANPEIRMAFNERFETQDYLQGVEFQVFKRDGQKIWISVNARVVRDDRGEPQYSEGSVIDITERKKSQERLELLKQSIDTSTDGAYWLTPDGHFAYVNDAACNLLGYSYEEMMEKMAWDVNVLIRDIPGRWERMWEQLRERGSYHVESINLTKDGKEIPVEIVSTYLQLGDQEYSCGFSRDISARKKAEKVLLDSENLYKTTIDSINDAIHVTDKDFRILVANHELMNWIDRYRLSPDIIGKTVRDEFPFLPESVDDEYRRVFETGKPVVTEEPIDLEGHHIITETRKLPVFDGEEVTRIVTSIVDITVKKQAELALERQSKIENLFARISTQFIDITPELVDQGIQEALDRLCEALEVDRISVNFFDENMSTFDRSIQGSRPGVQASIDAYRGVHVIDFPGRMSALQQGEFVKINDRAELKEDPTFFQFLEQAGTLSVLIAPLLARNKLYGIISFTMTTAYREWTVEDERLLKMLGEILVNAMVYKEQAEKQKLAETLVAQELEKLKDLDRLRTEFIFRASHELKTPLSGVIGAVGLLKESTSRFTPVERELLDIINRGGDRLRILIQRLVDSLRMEEESSNLAKETVDLVPIISGLVERLSFLSNLRKQELVLNLPNTIMGNVDPAKIETVMENLITNAINNTPVGGQIEVTARMEPDHVELVVRDTGVGFTKEEKANVFKKFGKIERYGQEMDVITEGSGLGLYISMRIIESHGGTITLESEGRDKGSKFTVFLPI
jgi:PAS domain S-box-containing protein